MGEKEAGGDSGGTAGGALAGFKRSLGLTIIPAKGSSMGLEFLWEHGRLGGGGLAGGGLDLGLVSVWSLSRLGGKLRRALQGNNSISFCVGPVRNNKDN